MNETKCARCGPGAQFTGKLSAGPGTRIYLACRRCQSATPTNRFNTALSAAPVMAFDLSELEAAA